MPISIGRNIASLRAQRQLERSSTELASTFERLSSGQRINSAGDDAAGLSISSKLEMSRRVTSRGIQNISDAQSMFAIADATLGSLSEILQRLQELASQAASGSLSYRQRASLDTEAQALSQEYTRIAQSTQFNGLGLFDGGLGNGLQVQAGIGENAVLNLAVGGSKALGTFSTAQDINEAGSTIGDVRLGDFDNDSKLDMIVGKDSLAFHRGNGDGTFSTGVTLATAGVTQFRTLTIGDFDGDRNLDVAAIGELGSNSLVLFYGQGDGTFSSTVTASGLGGLGAAHDIAAADLNGDGLTDFVTHTQNGGGDTYTSIILQSSNRRLTISSSVNEGAVNLRGATLSDINGDGRADLIEDVNSAITSRLGNGDGTFQGRQTIASPGNITSTIRLEDLDRDGDRDLVAASNLSTFAPVVLVSLNSGNGTFGVAMTYATLNGNGGPNDLVVGDFNGDGSLDVLTNGWAQTGEGAGLALLSGRGNGTFGSPVSIHFQTGSASTGNGLAAGDLNGDGVKDVVAAYSTPAGRGVRVLSADTQDGINPLDLFSLSYPADALSSLTEFKTRASLITTQRADIGVQQARLGSALAVLRTKKQSETEAQSRILDADMAQEAAQLMRTTVIQQAAIAVLAQARLQPEIALRLLSDI